MRILRTDEARFTGLPDYPFAPNYLDVAPNLRMHYVDEGPATGTPVLMLHGEPSWSYLYRHMIPLVSQAGYRVLAPDLIGFGKSDKPASVDDYSYDRHLTWLAHWLETLDLRNITLVCQNWGSLLGLRLAAEHPQRFSRIIVGNGMLPTGETRVPTVFSLWKAFATHSPWFPVGRIVQIGTERTLSKAELAAYEAPFPTAEYKAGARAFPKLVPVSPEDPASEANKAAWRVLEKWRKPFITCFSAGDPITRGGDRYMQRRIPGAHGQPHITLRGGHFLQEDSPEAFARTIIDALKTEMAA
ncbi:MAG: alpha/beta fold hydrolase [Gammaproteobacteria bacterium]|uniref:Haloalkane dehalogenase n=1 Tax=Marinobacter nitratireducens TaxID=1137280 RepID=A0A072N1X4_9GAMM|nr:haloalkane dehalogenase [Marinobacter nitratireducens]KEF31207.1 Haloalkane dehalogenase [Marinobacter nitratireducens]TNE77455.1 MAG: alpha/beta fold hydrolase [Gammaproteobacteria bacterium]TNE96024.1 MAG: alpha/beta fold hydrolase [Gammaproteobacteria bacterium]